MPGKQQQKSNVPLWYFLLCAAGMIAGAIIMPDPVAGSLSGLVGSNILIVLFAILYR